MKRPNLPLTLQHTLAPLIIMILAIIAFVFNDNLSSSLVYQRQFIAQGEFWRVLTGHFFHTNNYHLYLNVAALVMLWALHGQFYRISTYFILFISASISTSIGVYFFSPNIIQYVGLSGVLHGVFVWGALKDIQAKEKTGYLLFIGVWLKIAHEQIYGASNDVVELIGANVAVDAHLWGAIGGLLFYLLSFIIIQKSTVPLTP